MALILFLLVHAFLLLNKTVNGAQSLYEAIFTKTSEDTTVEESYTPECRFEFSHFYSPSSLDLDSLNLSEKDKKFNRKGKMGNGTPDSPFRDSSSSSPKSPGSISINEYSNSSQALTSDDDYFFFDLDSTENAILESMNQDSRPSAKKKTESAKEAPKLVEDFVIIGSEVIPKHQAEAMRGKHKNEEDTKDSLTSYYGLYDSIKKNFLLAISSISPKSVRKIFNSGLESSDKLETSENNENVGPAIVKQKSAMLKRESSDYFSDMIKRYYKVFDEPEIKDGEVDEETSDKYDDFIFGYF